MNETTIFRALGDPTRCAVYEKLASRELSVRELTDGFAVSQPAISQHLAVLRKAGLVSERRDGRNIYYRARPDGLTPLLDWIDTYSAFWPDRLGRLKSLMREQKP